MISGAANGEIYLYRRLTLAYAFVAVAGDHDVSTLVILPSSNSLCPLLCTVQPRHGAMCAAGTCASWTRRACCAQTHAVVIRTA